MCILYWQVMHGMIVLEAESIRCMRVWNRVQGYRVDVLLNVQTEAIDLIWHLTTFLLKSHEIQWAFLIYDQDS